MPNTEKWLSKVSDKVDEIEDLDQKLTQIQKTLITVTKSEELQKLNQTLLIYKTEITSLKRGRTALAKANQVEQLKKEVATL